MKKIVILLLVTVVFALWSVSSFSEMTYKEAPMLADMVKAGKLPSVEQRLPKEPLVIQPHEEIGRSVYEIPVRFSRV